MLIYDQPIRLKLSRKTHMIKNFRKNRQNTLTECKTEKYLKYALGEIILVMIVTLLALQVNNWNIEHRECTRDKVSSEYSSRLKERFIKIGFLNWIYKKQTAWWPKIDTTNQCYGY